MRWLAQAIYTFREIPLLKLQTWLDRHAGEE